MDQKGGQSGRGFQCWSRADDALPAERRSLNPSGMVRMRNVVSPTAPTGRWKAAREGRPMGERVWEAGGSERRSVMDRIGAQTLPYPERGQTSGWS